MEKIQVLNPEVLDKVRENGGYCPCKLEKKPENKCVCKEFRDKMDDPDYEGVCHCGLYYYGEEPSDVSSTFYVASDVSSTIYVAPDDVVVAYEKNKEDSVPSRGDRFDSVNRPEHYNQGGVECIDAIKAATTGLEGIEAVCTANVIKYLWRWKRKNGKEDIKKAIWYAERLLKEVGHEADN